jgi:hypothetical protein
METKSIMSHSSHKSQVKAHISLKAHITVNSVRAKALAAKAGFTFTLKEAEIKKYRAALDADLDTDAGRSFF